MARSASFPHHEIAPSSHHSDIDTPLDRYTHFVHENVEKLAQINLYCDTVVTCHTPQSQ